MNRFGYYIAILTMIMTIITFGVAISTPPISGQFCTDPCIEYPYTDIISRFPRDYIWMYLAICLNLIYVVLVVCIHQYTTHDKKIFGQIGLSFAIISASILNIDYFIQVTIIKPSLLRGETEGIALLTQYNPHGIFIALEELGYLMMSFSFLCLAFVFSKTDKLERTIRSIFIASFIMVILSFALVLIKYGVNREYIFECIVISIDWIVLIIAGILLSKLFKRAL